jgi:hypothetical protein
LPGEIKTGTWNRSASSPLPALVAADGAVAAALTESAQVSAFVWSYRWQAVTLLPLVVITASGSRLIISWLTLIPSTSSEAHPARTKDLYAERQANDGHRPCGARRGARRP